MDPASAPNAGSQPANPPRRASILIAAAGQGDRLGLGPKGRLTLSGRWLAQWVHDVARRVSEDVIVAIPRDESVADWQPRLPAARLVHGGDTRFASLAAMLAIAREPWIVLADAARPFVTPALIDEVLAAADTDVVAAAVAAIATPIAEVANGEVGDLRSNQGMFTVETPIALHRDCLAHALDVAGGGDRHLSELLFRLGYRFRASLSPRFNLKITHPGDWPLAEAIAERWPVD